MKTTFVLDIQKDKYEYTSLIVTGRMGDLESNTVDVYIKNGGEPCPLTNLTVFYECVKPDDTAIRDKEGVNIIDAAKGHFTYTFPAEVFSAPGQVKRSFFSIEKDKTFRATTQDFLVSSLHDALTGHIESETYISEFDKALEMVAGHQKQIDEANKRINELTAAVTGQKYQLWKVTDDDGTSIDLAPSTDLNTIVKSGSYVGNQLKNMPNNSIYTWFISVESATSSALVQKATLLGNWNETYIRVNNSGKWSDWSRLGLASEIVPKTGGIFTGEITFSGGLKQATDTNWTNLKTTGVENVPDRPLKYKRTGGLVTVMGSIRNPKNVVDFATLPEGFRPPQDVAFSVVIISGSTTAGEFTIQKGGGLFVSGAPANATCHLVASYVV
ncbi:BppU family phage baseplate upper protein [Bacillus thuringiensis]|uniref:BppU family phage baseplate upper protein n=1 Tax=Bacillus thuringiensis TaxID=1428 RepID=UPI0026E13F65|nr:BppU family phage baseplate upper protein [Bacillus thuringiensis]MDO6629418.1 BppU family phage baseplate upper protein [Bacillus thuringiensis]MDO6663741.1 BppU family phage baseplate upper protein [Bacillus thuringiensis]MDO6699513.1 BppU family phage baseplate upper protein [Bacillus thuringiensis]